MHTADATLSHARDLASGGCSLSLITTAPAEASIWARTLHLRGGREPVPEPADLFVPAVAHTRPLMPTTGAGLRHIADERTWSAAGTDDVAMTALSLIGFWRAEGDWTSEYPDPRDWVDTEWDEDERHATWFYFATGTLFRAFMGYSPCRICGENNGAVEYTDGTYVWPEGLAHYVHDHAVRLPDELIAHAPQHLDSLEGRDVASDWWVGATAKT